MSLRESLAVGSAPVFLRLALGVTFLWAGLAKVVHRTDFSGQDAATLANYGIVEPAIGGASLEPIAFFPVTAQDEQPEQDEQDESRPDNRQPDGSPPPPLDDDDLQEAVQPSAPVGQYSAAQFAEPVEARSLHNITLMLHNAMMPGVNPDTQEPTIALWFDVDASKDFDPWPVYFAWAVAGTELIAGGLLLLGLLTRLSALGIAGTMVGAIWLTTIGPAIQSGQTTLGILPSHDLFDMYAWKTPLWQFALLMASLALFCTGSGAAGIDRLLFGNPFFYKAPDKKSD